MEMDSSCVPPGFRFHPTEEELVGYYLQRKITSLKIDLDVISDIDLYNMEPWDIEDRCKLGYEEQNEWYFFSHKDRKYPTGTRTNRATAAGFWKATGRDKAVLSKERIIGMRKTLVYYKGRAPTGRKSDWIMHEYRLQTSEHGPPQEEGWVVCRAFKKPNPSQKQSFEAWNNAYYVKDKATYNRPPTYPSTSSTSIVQKYDQETNFYQLTFPSELPKLNSPSVIANNEDSAEHEKSNFGNQYSEWKSFDKLLESDGQVFDAGSSYTFTNMPLLDPHNDVLECFSDL